MAALHWVDHGPGRYHAKGSKFGVDYWITRTPESSYWQWKLEEYGGEVDGDGRPVFTYVDRFPTLRRARAHAQYREGAPAHLGIGPAAR